MNTFRSKHSHKRKNIESFMQVLVILVLILTIKSANPIPGSKPKRIAPGAMFSCLIRNNYPQCVGQADLGALGDNKKVNSKYPVKIYDGITKGRNFVAVTAGFASAFALDEYGKAFSWGDATNAVLANATADQKSEPAPIEVDQSSSSSSLKDKKIIDFSLGYDFGLALDSDGYISSWGKNFNGQLGLGEMSFSYELTPKSVKRTGALNGKTIASVECARNGGSAYAISTDGILYAWGKNEYGQLGIGTLKDVGEPTIVSGAGAVAASSLLNKKVIAIAAGQTHTLVLDSDNLVHSFGENYKGQLGIGSTSNLTSIPILISSFGALKDKKIALISAGTGSSFAVDVDGLVYAFGLVNYLGACRWLPSETYVATPISMLESCASVNVKNLLAGLKVLEISTNSGHTLVYADDNQFYSWGVNNDYSLGDGTGVSRLSPVRVVCPFGFVGANCEHEACNSIPKTEPTVCSGHGKCVSAENCDCDPGYSGNYCQKTTCFGMNQTTLNVCRGLGQCVALDTCACKNGYFGKECELKTLGLLIDEFFEIASEFVENYYPIIGVVLLCIFALGVCCCCVTALICSLCGGLPIVAITGICFTIGIQRRKREQEKKEIFHKLLDESSQNVELSGQENEFGKGIDMSVFNLDFKDFKIVQELTSGGSGALCMEAIDKRNDENVFIKLFVLKKDEKTNEWDVSQFKNEITLFTRLRHPNIVTFFGLFFTPPSRVGYVCEFCKQGTIASYIKSLRHNDSMNPKSSKMNMHKKLDWLIQIGQGMRYLHQKEVIFRDLKPENVLIGKGDLLKLTDFGISKLVSDANKANMTKNAGTPFYMAPEVVKGLNYDNKVDVYSFAIVMFEILFETIEPFGKHSSQYGIEFNVAQDPNFRPQIDMDYLEIQKREKKEVLQNVVLPLIELMKKCWDHDPTNRPDFREIVNEISRIQQILEEIEHS